MGKWLGKCPNCDAWNSIVEKQETRKNSKIEENKSIEIGKIKISNDERVTSGLSELDYSLGGGFVKGSFILLSGDPGVGKSTLTLMLSSYFEKKVLYISGEETLGQIASRAKRMKIKKTDLKVLNSSDFGNIKNEIEKEKPELIIIDSIQTIQNENFQAKAGVTQIKEVTFELMDITKRINAILIVIGHITKDGSVAGPKVLEHMVDTVLYFGGNNLTELRTINIRKNRFGPLDRTCLLKMNESGLTEVITNILDKEESSECGYVYGACLKGNKLIFKKVEALVIKTTSLNGKRICEGYDQARIIILIALIEKYLKINLSNFDIYLNISEGSSVKSKDLDLAIICSILSSYLNKPIKNNKLFYGEIGLSGNLNKPKYKNFDEKSIELNNFIHTYAHKEQTRNNIIPINSVGEIIDKVFL